MADAATPPPPDRSLPAAAASLLAPDGAASNAAGAVGRSLCRAFAAAADVPLSPRLATLLRQLE